MKRLFAALKICPDPAFLTSFRKMKADLKHEQIKWVEEHNIHITLKFFGDTDERRIPEICTILEQCARSSDVITLRLSGLGIFGSSYSPRVVWVGIEPYQSVVRLMDEIHSALAGIGFERDRQNLVPHLTLGRIKFLRDKTIFRRIVDGNRNMASLSCPVGEIILYESILHREGPEYKALGRFPLNRY